MRVLTVSAFFESHGGGVEMVAAALARAMARRGHDSYVTGAAFDAAPVDASITAIPLPSRDPIERYTGLPMPIPTKEGVARLVAEVEAADAVIIHDSLYVSSILAARAARRLRKPWVLIQHIGAIPYANPILRATLSAANFAVTRRMLGAASQALFISDIVQQHFQAVQYARPPKLMFNGVDKNLFRCARAGDREMAQVEFRLEAPYGLRLLFVGRFVEKKGLTALRALAMRCPQTEFILVGDGPIDPASWGLPNIGLLGRRTSAELARLYRACDGLVLPSVGEGYPLVVQEALASGLAVYCGLDSASADPAAAPFLHGVAVDPHNPEATAHRFAAAIAEHPPVINPCAAAYAAARYDWDANAAEIEAMILAARS